eukprot:GHVP01048360.1.p1 GENE.GHVP01048360.1~~GHVP01048360.1.p1  ORF type:complete len:502 (+),score=84.12 GHVP01048360.1:44-1549(+)
MSLICCISGVVPEEPVCSKTGYIFEKRLIEQHIIDQAKCPMTQTELTVDDLVPLKFGDIPKPRPSGAASVPGLLKMLCNEWDAVATETFQLRQHLETVRTQLAHTLYQHDAACRVIARLMRDRDASRAQVTQLQQQLSTLQSRGSGVLEDLGISQQVVEIITQKSDILMGRRKNRKAASMVPPEPVTSMEVVKSFSLHSTTEPGITCLSLDNRSDAPNPSFVATGGKDGLISVFDVDKEVTIGKLTGHLKPISRVILCRNSSAVVSASDDKTIRVFNCGNFERFSYQSSHTIRKHESEVRDISLHPTEDFLASCCGASSWCFHDIASGRTLQTFETDAPYNAIAVHPDGRITGGASSSGMIDVWDFRKPTKALTGSLKAHTGGATALSFSENGFYLATTGHDGILKLWDLRKSLCFDEIDMKDHKHAEGLIHFDHSGLYFGAITGNNNVVVRTFEDKIRTKEAFTISGHSEPITDFAFGAGMDFVVSCSLDRKLQIWRTSV